MCRPVTCKTCKKTTWAGCGSHVASVKAMVPADQWCGGHDASEKKSGESFGESLFRRMFGR